MNPLLKREQTLRLFQQLHQNDFYYDYWKRGSGNSICTLCGLEFRNHLDDEEHPLGEWGGIYYDKRLCNGDIRHL